MEKAVHYLREQAVIANQSMLMAEGSGDDFSADMYHAKMNAYIDAIRVVIHGDEGNERVNAWHKEYDIVQRMSRGVML